MMTQTLDPETVAEIQKIGLERRPAEACGVLLPYAWRGQRVWEMPNRSMTSHDSFELHTEDISMTLEDWINEVPESDWEQITIWHTHPGGNLGPSKTDLNNRMSKCGNLVITLYDEDDAKATWY